MVISPVEVCSSGQHFEIEPLPWTQVTLYPAYLRSFQVCVDVRIPEAFGGVSGEAVYIGKELPHHPCTYLTHVHLIPAHTSPMSTSSLHIPHPRPPHPCTYLTHVHLIPAHTSPTSTSSLHIPHPCPPHPCTYLTHTYAPHAYPLHTSASHSHSQSLLVPPNRMIW